MIELPHSIAAHLAAGGQLIVPSRQRAAAVRRAVAWCHRGSDAVWSTPQVFPWRAWLARRATQCGLPRALSTHEEWLVWRTTLATLVDREAGQPLDSLADGLQRAAAMVAEYGIPETALQDFDSTETHWLREGMAAVRRAATARAAIASFDLALRVAAATTEANLEPKPRLCGISLTPVLRMLGFEAADFIDGSGQGRVVAHAACDRDEELAAIATWARAHLDRDPRARLLVVLPDLDARRAAIDRVLRESLTPNCLAGGAVQAVYEFEGGRPLAEAPEVRAALEVLQALVRPVERAQLAQILEAFHWSPSYGARAQTAEVLRRGPADTIAPAAVASHWRTAAGLGLAAGAIEECIRAFEAARAAIESERHPGLRIAKALAELGWDQNGGTDSVSQQTRAAFGSLLSTLPQVLAAASGARYPTSSHVVSLLSALARREYFAPSIGDTAVTVTAACDHPVVRYDGIWCGGLQSDRWPAPARIDPFVPWELQRSCGVATASAAARLEAAREFLARIAQCGDEVVHSWACADGEAEWSPSVLLHRSSQRDAEHPPRVIEPAPVLASQLRAAAGAVRESLLDVNGLPWNTAVTVPGGSYALAEQSDCPFRAYARTRLVGRDAANWEPGVSALDRGKLLHKVLERFWSQVGSSEQLRSLSHDERERLLESALEVLPIAKEFALDELGGRALMRERLRLQKVIAAALPIEEKRASFVVANLEQELDLRLDALQFKLRPDRVDRLTDGRLVVMDYKSGSHKALDFFGDRPNAVQLFSYARALEEAGERIAGFGNLTFTLRGAKASSVYAAADVLPGRSKKVDWEAFRRSYADVLSALGAEFARGDARVAPRKRACEYCELTPLCRRTEVGLQIALQDADDATEDES